MTKSRKIGISTALLLIFVLACAVFVPLYVNNNVNTAEAVTVQSRSEWVNTYDGTYYDNLNTNQTGEAFYNDLANLITKTHTYNPTYDGLKDLFKTTDADPENSGNVIWFYTGDSAKYNGIMDTNSGYPTGYPSNREHVWPKMAGQAFPETSEAGSDAHHLRPLNSGLNNTRSNNHFGIVPQTTGNRVMQSGTLSSYGTSDLDTWCYQATVNGMKTFYPAKGYRGATARILFYVQTRWGKTSKLSFTLGNGSAKVMSNVDILLQWHLQEPPTDEEIRRNNAVASFQGNRNPFIDHPEFAEMIYCHDGNSYNNKLQQVVATFGSYLDNSNGGGGGTEKPELTSISLSISSINLTVGQSSAKITVTANPYNADNSVTWSTSNDSVASVSKDGVVTAKALGSATITATSTVNSNIRASLTVNVISQEQNSQVFADSLQAIDRAVTLRERYDAIKSAIDAFNQMTESEQNTNRTNGNYAKLQEAISKYNEDVNKINGEFESATDLASQIMAYGVSVAFMALVAIVVKRMLWR